MRTHTALVTLIGRGKVTIPKEVRDVLNLKDGDIIELKITKIQEEEMSTKEQVNSNESPRKASVTV